MFSTALPTALLLFAVLLAFVLVVMAWRAAERAAHYASELKLAIAACKACELQLRTAVDRCDQLDGKLASLRGLVYRGRRGYGDGEQGHTEEDLRNAPGPSQAATDDDEFSNLLALQRAPAAGPG